jgi:hypothetical protein
MTGAFEFEDVFKIIIGFRQSRQRTAFAQREMYRVTFTVRRLNWFSYSGFTEVQTYE